MAIYCRIRLFLAMNIVEFWGFSILVIQKYSLLFRALNGTAPWIRQKKQYRAIATDSVTLRRIFQKLYEEMRNNLEKTEINLIFHWREIKLRSRKHFTILECFSCANNITSPLYFLDRYIEHYKMNFACFRVLMVINIELFRLPWSYFTGNYNSAARQFILINLSNFIIFKRVSILWVFPEFNQIDRFKRFLRTIFCSHSKTQKRNAASSLSLPPVAWFRKRNQNTSSALWDPRQ